MLQRKCLEVKRVEVRTTDERIKWLMVMRVTAAAGQRRS